MRGAGNEAERRISIDRGYIRASTDAQRSTLLGQREALVEAGCKPEHIFVDDGVGGKANLTVSGTAWQELRAQLRPGDRLVVKSHTRLGRKNHEIIYAVGTLIEQGVHVWDLDAGQVYDDLDSFQQVIQLNLNSAFADRESLEPSHEDQGNSAFFRGRSRERAYESATRSESS